MPRAHWTSLLGRLESGAKVGQHHLNIPNDQAIQSMDNSFPDDADIPR